MAETGRTGGPAPAGGAPKQDLEERWKDVVEVLTERPRDVNLLVRAGELSEQLNRRPEAYNYFHKALTLDPSKSYLVSRLQALAGTPAQRDEVTKISRRPVSFTAGLPGVFKYPLKGKGLPILLMGALLLWVGRALASRGIGTSGLTIAAVISAYMAMFYIDVCHSTVGGDDELPEWPDPLRLHEFGLDVGKFLCATVVSFLPVLVILFIAGSAFFSATPEDLEAMTEPVVPASPAAADPDDDETPAPVPAPAEAPKPVPVRPPRPEISPLAGTLILSVIGIVVFGIVGLVYLPMATLTNVVMGSPFTCFNFPFVFRSIGAASKDYGICLAAYFVTSVVVFGAEVVVRAADVMVLTGFGLAFLELFGMTVLMRMLGLFYRMNQARLGWMAD